MTTYDESGHRSTGLALALLATPLLWLVAELVSPELHTDAAGQLTEISRHPDRWFLYTVLLTAGLGTCIAAAVGLGRLAGGRLGRTGSLLLSASLVIAIGDAMSQLVFWQMVEPGADRAQMVALMTRFDEAPGNAAVFGIGGLAYLVGTVLLTIALGPDAGPASVDRLGDRRWVDPERGRLHRGQCPGHPHQLRRPAGRDGARRPPSRRSGRGAVTRR